MNIDKSKLKRDYQLNPLKWGEEPFEEDLRYLYIELNMAELDIRKFFNKTRGSVKKWFKKWNLIKSKEQRIEVRKRNYKKEFGSENIWDRPGYKEKITKVFREKYGTDYPLQNKELREKALIKYNEFKKDLNRQRIRVEKIKKTNEYLKGVKWDTQAHIPIESIKILESPTKFREYIMALNETERSIHIIAEKLKVHYTNISQKIIKYHLRELIKYNQAKETTFHREIMQILDSWSIKYSSNDRQIIKPLEIDIYIPSKQIGIEFNGNYWHSINNKGRNYHQDKSLLGESKDIFIYHIFEYEWENKNIKNKIINQLRNLLGLNEYKIFARKCKIKEVSTEEAKKFLELNHLQGADKAKIKLGLYFDNELVAIMTFCKPRFNKKFEWELSRFCCKANTTVVGGASKLFQYFIKNYNPENIISYSDIAHTKGKLYEKLGFKLDHISKPNYRWNKRHITLTRYECQTKKLYKQFPQYKDLSETEIMGILGYSKIEDSGNKVWYYYNQLNY